MRIPFNIGYRPQIESGEYKVETRDGNSVRIICWDKDGSQPIVALVSIYSEFSKSFKENIFQYGTDGHYIGMWESEYDLYILTPEEELTEFEIHLLNWLSDDTSGEIPMERMKEVVRNRAAELLAIARKELEPEVLEHLEEAYKNQDEVVYENGKRDGKAEALKDLPRWRERDNGAAGNSEGHPIALVSGAGGIRFVSVLGVHGEKYIMLDDLKKLPGFKEDEE